MTPFNLIEEISRRHPADAPAVVAGERVVTFGELFGLARPIAESIRQHNTLDRHPRIGLHCPNGLDYIILSLGILLADACLVPLAEELTQDERDEITQTTALDFIVKGAPHHSMINWEIETVESPAVQFPESEFQSLNPAFIRFSSGTTGTSKGVVLSHETLLARITAANEGLQLGPQDRVLWMLPMAHHFAVSIVLYLHVGALTILEHSPLREDILATAEKHQATVIYGSPFHFSLLSGDTSDFQWPSLRLPVATAAALPEITARAFEQRFSKPLVQGLGIIEVGLSVLNLDAASEKPTSLGKALPAYQVRLVDDHGSPVPDGAPGEFQIRGPGLLDAYLVPWNPSPLTDGWFSSGDLVVRDSDDYLTLVGRKKSVINIAGMKAFPEEIEAILNTHPDVKRSRVLGREHPQMGQIPVAEIIPADPSAPPKPLALQKHCRLHLSAYKVPMRFSFVDTLPLTASGKIKRT
ncbi:class I adenylate-forming enzyme family protein [Haloferula chungangensis]|uniref:Class I adenylate-forming enzyme family protein n=1 Tax=Haloferula chungangensis TaxID=1048331 RepID=A0ABW2LAI9_9BACT